VERLSFRPIRGEQDAEALRSLQLDRKVRDAVDPLSSLESIPTLESLRQSLSEAVATARQANWLVAEVDRRVVGYGRIASWPERDGTWVYLALGWVTPAWRGRGIGTALLRHTEGRIRELAAAEHPPQRGELAANASSTELEATALLRNEGYQVAYRLLEMGLDAASPVPDAAPKWPSGIEVRRVTPGHCLPLARSVQEAYEGEYPGGRYDASADPAEFAAQLCEALRDAALWQVAWDGDQIAGQVLSVLEDGRAEVFEVSVRPPWRRRGLARALLFRALRGLRSRNVDVIRLHTRPDFQTRAVDLYASLGFRVLKEFPRYRKPLARDPAPGGAGPFAPEPP
jgi:ribosomal protein S18 acetylase RimI-like enzyme